MINKQQQLNISHYQYIYTMYCKLLCLQNLSSVISILSSEPYTPAGNITSKKTEHGNYTYGYDNLDRLTNADYPTLTDEIFTYDALGACPRTETYCEKSEFGQLSTRFSLIRVTIRLKS